MYAHISINKMGRVHIRIYLFIFIYLLIICISFQFVAAWSGENKWKMKPYNTRPFRIVGVAFQITQIQAYLRYPQPRFIQDFTTYLLEWSPPADNRSDISSVILLGILSGIISRIYFDILPGIGFGMFGHSMRHLIIFYLAFCMAFYLTHMNAYETNTHIIYNTHIYIYMCVCVHSIWLFIGHSVWRLSDSLSAAWAGILADLKHDIPFGILSGNLSGILFDMRLGPAALTTSWVIWSSGPGDLHCIWQVGKNWCLRYLV